MRLDKKETFSWWLIHYLINKHGIERAFLMTGGGIFHLCKALSDKQGELKSLFFYHEQQAIFAAEGFSKINNDYSLVIGTSGPGATNLVTGLVSAYQDSVPVIAITGQCNTDDYLLYQKFDKLRQAGTFDNDFGKFVQKYTKRALQINNTKNGIFEIGSALKLAKDGRPGPIVIEIPLDIQGELITYSDYLQQINLLEGLNTSTLNLNIDSKDIINKIIDEIESKKRIVILAGRGCVISNTWDSLFKLSKTHNIPILTTYAAKTVRLSKFENWCGVTGLKGSYSGNNIIDKSDLVISIGNTLHQQTVGWNFNMFIKKKRIIYIDIDKILCEKYKSFESIITFNLDIKIFIDIFYKALNKVSSKTMNNIQNWSFIWQRMKNTKSILEIGKNINPGFSLYQVLDTFNIYSKKESIIVSDSGTTWYVTGQVLNLKEGQSFVSSSAMGSMGFALPASIGIASTTGKHVYCLLGDGSLMTALSSLWTISREKLPITILIMNNKGYNSISNTQAKFSESKYYGSNYNSGLPIIDMKSIAKSSGINYSSIQNQSLFIKALNSSKKLPFMMDLMINEKTIVVPYVKSILQRNGKISSNSLNQLEPRIDN